ncbi:MAG: LPS export ABC transporter permease LptF [Alphaproteobacteria bacterium]|nr:MAG: LPS export ABC transporter permease LptF [Alphaproteobacteria bacterium]
MISIFDKYVLKNLIAATWITAISLTMIVLLTQSIRFLELVISSDASSAYFAMMMGLAIPKFLEAILPIAFSIGIIFTCYRLILDREMIVMFAAGLSAFRLGRAFFIFALAMMAIQFMLSGWVSPIAVDKLQRLRGDIKSHYATLMFREGVFNSIGPDMTAYVEKRVGLNELKNLMIHDERGTLSTGKVTTILAKRGIVDISENAQRILVYDGTQYEYDPKNGTTNRLDFKRYSLDIPENTNTIGARWREPDERILPELFIDKDTAKGTDLKNYDEFIAEAHRRLSTPFLYISYTAISIGFLLLGSWNRRQQSGHIIKAGACIVLIQALYIVLYNESRDAILLSAGLYLLAIIPGLIALYYLYPNRHKVTPT